MIHRLSRKEYFYLLTGAVIIIIIYSSATLLTSESSKTRFCILCHEMRIVAEQGWMKSQHFNNDQGVVAQCEDCHIPPELISKIWTKTRDGLKDIAVHVFGESDPLKMPWDDLSRPARSNRSDSSCMRCHKNLTPHGSSIKTIVAHRAYLRMKDKKRCVDCHRTPFHGKFKDQLSVNILTNDHGGSQ